MRLPDEKVLGLLAAAAVIGGRFWLLEERVEITRQTCATLTKEVKELREAFQEAQISAARREHNQRDSTESE